MREDRPKTIIFDDPPTTAQLQRNIANMIGERLARTMLLRDELAEEIGTLIDDLRQAAELLRTVAPETTRRANCIILAKRLEEKAIALNGGPIE